MTGGLYLWKDGREVPDTMNVSMEHPEEMMVSWDSGFGNDQWKSAKTCSGTTAPSPRPAGFATCRKRSTGKDGNGMAGPYRNDPKAHMQNFIDCIRVPARRRTAPSTRVPRSIACRMAVDSYRRPYGALGPAKKKSFSYGTHGFRIHRGAGSSFGKTVREFAKRKSPRTSSSGMKPRFSRSKSIKKLRRARLHGRHFPGGTGRRRLGYIEYAIIIEELSRVDPRLASSSPRTIRSARTTYISRATTSSAASTFPSWPPANGSAAGR